MVAMTEHSGADGNVYELPGEDKMLGKVKDEFSGKIMRAFYRWCMLQIQ